MGLPHVMNWPDRPWSQHSVPNWFEHTETIIHINLYIVTRNVLQLVVASLADAGISSNPSYRHAYGRPLQWRDGARTCVNWHCALFPALRTPEGDVVGEKPRHRPKHWQNDTRQAPCGPPTPSARHPRHAALSLELVAALARCGAGPDATCPCGMLTLSPSEAILTDLARIETSGPLRERKRGRPCSWCLFAGDVVLTASLRADC